MWTIIYLTHAPQCDKLSIMENWLPIKDYEGLYEVSDQGRVRRIKDEDNTWNGRIIAGGSDQDGYRVLLLYKNGKRRMFKAHRLVAIAFVPNPTNAPQVNHKNAIKNDNRADNLEWTSCKENINHAVNLGLWNPSRGSARPNAKLHEKDIPVIRQLRLSGQKSKDIAVQFGVSPATIDDAVARRTWAWL